MYIFCEPFVNHWSPCLRLTVEDNTVELRYYVTHGVGHKHLAWHGTPSNKLIPRVAVRKLGVPVEFFTL